MELPARGAIKPAVPGWRQPKGHCAIPRVPLLGWQQCCPCQRGAQRAGPVLRVKSQCCHNPIEVVFNHLKVAPCPLPRFALGSLPTF